MTAQSALVLFIPEAERLINQYRQQANPPLIAELSAHVTILYPFVPPDQVDPEVLAKLTDLFADCASLEFALADVRRFPDVLYLAPTPEAPIQQLIAKVQSAFPSYLPYGGAFDTVIPHVTIARNADPERLRQMEREFDEFCDSQMPVYVQANEVTLIENTTGRWEERARFRLF